MPHGTAGLGWPSTIGARRWRSTGWRYRASCSVRRGWACVRSTVRSSGSRTAGWVAARRCVGFGSRERRGAARYRSPADTVVLRIADAGFAIDGVHLALGPPDHLTRLDIATLAGTGTSGGIAGTFAGGSGAIANVPLLLREATGNWRFAGGALSVTGTLGVADGGAPTRFQAARGARGDADTGGRADRCDRRALRTDAWGEGRRCRDPPRPGRGWGGPPT